MRPMVSVVIPVFNRAWQLRRALDSLKNQTFSDFEVIVCDDGSSEDIATVVECFKDLLRIKLIRMENSGGPATPRNCGVREANSEWISFLDSDDWWVPSRLARIKDILSGDVDLLYHQLKVNRIDNSARVNPPNGSILGERIKKGEPILHMLRSGNPIPTSSVIVRKEMLLKINGFDESSGLRSVEDFDMWMRLCIEGARISFVPTVLGFYYVGDDQISAFNVTQYERQANLFSKMRRILPKKYQRIARNNFGYLLGSYALDLGLSSVKFHFDEIEIQRYPWLWFKANIKRFRSYLNSKID